MTTTPILTGRDIGEAEHAIRALLDRLLERADLSFPGWTVLFTLDGAGPLPRSALLRRLIDGLKLSGEEAMATIDGLQSSGLVAPAGDAAAADGPPDRGTDPLLVPTPSGEAVYRPVRQAVARTTGELYGNLPVTDLEATHRTLAEVTRRANALLADASG
jgi:DNA-binding MarR family transcriptional regulator